LACVASGCGVASTSGWSAPVAVSNGDTPAYDLALGGDAAGHALAAWASESDGVSVARFDRAARAWGPPVAMAAGEGAADQLRLAVGAEGDAVVLWRQLSVGLQSVWSSWFDPAAAAWRPPTLVERDDTGDAAEPCVAALPAGGAVAVWHQWDGLRESLWSNTLGAAPLRWTGRSLLETTDSADALEPDVATDPRGNAVAVWTQDDGDSVTVWTARRAVDVGTWSAPSMLSANGLSATKPAPRVALDAAGNGLAIWSLNTGRASGVWASRYDARSDTWSAAVPLEETHPFAVMQDVALAIDGGGDAFALWRRSDEDEASLWASTFSMTTSSWGAALRLDDGVGPPAVAAAGHRQAVAVWRALGDDRIQASRFDTGAQHWSPSTRLDGNDGDSADPRISVGADGDAVAIFTGGRRVWSVHARP
jgi:hypothetical protein